MLITRRTVVKSGLLAGVAGSTGLWKNSLLAQPLRIRYSASSPQGQAMLAKYAIAVGLMMDPTRYPPTDPRSWRFQWYTHWVPGPSSPWSSVLATKQQMLDAVFAGLPANHPSRLLAEAMWDTCQAHGSDPNDPGFFQQIFFCVWHRFFVYYFEEIIRSVLSDQTFTLPYWNYLSGNAVDLAIPPAFRNTNSALYRADRNPWVNNGQRIDRDNPGSLNLDALNEPTYINSSAGFCPIVDNNPHGLVHVYVGTTTNMGRVPTAANDPVFWLHHCNIDRLWESWNQMPNHPNPAWPNRTFPFADQQGNAVNALTANADRPSLLNYQYDMSSSPPSPPGGLRIIAGLSEGTRLAASKPVVLDGVRTRVVLAPSGGPASGNESLMSAFALSSPSRRLYLVLREIAAPVDASTTYNVFLNLPTPVANPAADHPHCVGTLHFFSASGHDDHGKSGHPIVFNITEKARALLLTKALTSTATVTFIRHGEAERGHPVIGQIVVTEA